MRLSRFKLKALSFASGVGLTYSATATQLANNDIYPYCNVFAQDVCFGVDRGDELTMRLPFDFITYDFKLEGGLSGQIYSGNHANISGAPFADQALQCIDEGRSCSFASPFGRGIWLLYISKAGSQTEVRIPEFRKETVERGMKFLDGFRVCDASSEMPVCSHQKAFGDLSALVP
jgi:hypothetical protein